MKESQPQQANHSGDDHRPPVYSVEELTGEEAKSALLKIVQDGGENAERAWEILKKIKGKGN